MNKLIDLTIPIYDAMSVYPGDEIPRLQRISSYKENGFTNFKLCAGMHIGTHIDGPMHLTNSEQLISDIILDHFVGNGCILNVAGEKIISNKSEYISLIPQESIVLLYTSHSKKFGNSDYYDNYPVVSKELAGLLVEKKIKMLCLDFPSPDRTPHEIHKLLLDNNILIAENLTNLDKLLDVKSFEVIALPLNIKSDSSPARIIARINR